MAMHPGLIRLLSAAHLKLLGLTRGRWGRTLGRNRLPVLVLTTKGRRSGKHRSVPLVYLADGEDFVLVGSFGGNDQHPDWVLNLRAHTEATINVDGRRLEVMAEEAGEEEHERLWPNVVALWPGYAAYQGRTDRRIPLVVLRRKPTIVQP